MTYRVDISGLDDLIEAIEEAKKLDDKRGRQNDTAYMANQIAEETPVRSGYLKRSETPSIKDDGMTGEVEAMADYSAYVEYGTRYMYGRFYMKKGIQQQLKDFLIIWRR